MNWPRRYSVVKEQVDIYACIDIRLSGVCVGSVLSFLVCVLGVLVVVVVPASEFAVVDGMFSSVYSMVFVVDFASPGWCFAAFVDAVFVSGDDGSAHGYGESGALCANVEWL